MTIRTALRNPLVAAAFGALLGAAPLTAIYSLRPANAANNAVTKAQPRGGVSVSLPDFTPLIKRYGSAVVSISVIEKSKRTGAQQNPFGPNSPFAPFFHNFPYRTPHHAPIRGEGSGFIIRPDGVILTNAHVVAGASKVTVQLRDRREYPGKVIGIDKISDVAVVKIHASDLPTVQLGNSDSLQVGQWVLAIGAPFGFDNTATAGIVSAKDRRLPDSHYVPFIQTDVPINPGNSGGPLFNMQGQVVGINSQIYSRSGGYMGLSFSIPINVAMNVADQLMSSGHVRRGLLGVLIQPVDQGLADSFGLPEPEGALIASVSPHSAAAKAGLKAGDVILAMNGRKVGYADELPVRVASLKPGTEVHLTIWRNHAERHINVKLGSMGNGTLASAQNQQHPGGRLGLVVRSLTADERQQANVPGGLLVQAVSGPAEDAGIQPGDIVLSANGQPVDSAAQLHSVVSKSHGHVALLIQRNGVQHFVPIQVQ